LEEDIPDLINTWSFNSILGSSSFITNDTPGKDILVEKKSFLDGLLQRYMIQARYECSLNPRYLKEDDYRSLATNRFGDFVSLVMIHHTHVEDTFGFTYIFPNIVDKAGFLAEFFASYLPEFKPELFPGFEGSKWIQRPEYEIPSIQLLKKQIADIQADSSQRIAELQKSIELERFQNAYLYDLVTTSDERLVSAVQTALQVIGFQNVVDMDSELANNGEGDRKREDLQIRDTSPLVLVEVKGVSGTITDKDALQVSNYLVPRMKSLDRRDVRGLSIINHQRHIPLLDRKDNPFSEDVITTSESTEIGLMTSWSLYRLIRNYLKFGWSHDQVSELFYREGYIEPIPVHYEYVGNVEHYWEQNSVVGIRINGATLRHGDRVAFELPVEFDEQEVKSLQIEKTPVEVAKRGELAGVLTSFTKQQLPKRTRVFRIKSL